MEKEAHKENIFKRLMRRAREDWQITKENKLYVPYASSTLFGIAGYAFGRLRLSPINYLYYNAANPHELGTGAAFWSSVFAVAEVYSYFMSGALEIGSIYMYINGRRRFNANKEQEKIAHKKKENL